MRKILFEIFDIHINSYGLLIAIGVLIAGYMFIKRGKEKEYNEEYLFDLAMIGVVSGFLGAKILFIIVEIKKIINDPSILLKIGEGFVVYGGIIGGALGVFFYCKYRKWNILEILDLAVPSLAIGQGFGRIGCFLAGCCYGIETNSFLGVEFPIDSLAPSGVHLHPTQLYSSVFDFALCIILLIYSKRNRDKGTVFALYIIIYSIGRFAVEFLRNDPRGNVGILSTSQFISIATFILGITIFYYGKNKRSVNKSEK